MTRIHIHTGASIDGSELDRLAASILERGPRKARPKRDALYAFAWHTAEMVLVGILTVVAAREYPLLLIPLCLLAVVGWAWSLGHLPGRSA